MQNNRNNLYTPTLNNSYMNAPAACGRHLSQHVQFFPALNDSGWFPALDDRANLRPPGMVQSMHRSHCTTGGQMTTQPIYQALPRQPDFGRRMMPPYMSPATESIAPQLQANMFQTTQDTLLPRPQSCEPRSKTVGGRGSSIPFKRSRTEVDDEIESLHRIKKRKCETLKQSSNDHLAPIQVRAHVQDEDGHTVAATKTFDLRLPSAFTIRLPDICRPLDPLLRKQTLQTMRPSIVYIQFGCSSRCRSRGICVHYTFVLGADKVSDGLICEKCMNARATSRADVETCISGIERQCVRHSANSLQYGNNWRLPDDILPSREQHLRASEILRRSCENDWADIKPRQYHSKTYMVTKTLPAIVTYEKEVSVTQLDEQDRHGAGVHQSSASTSTLTHTLTPISSFDHEDLSIEQDLQSPINLSEDCIESSRVLAAETLDDSDKGVADLFGGMGDIDYLESNDDLWH